MRVWKANNCVCWGGVSSVWDNFVGSEGVQQQQCSKIFYKKVDIDRGKKKMRICLKTKIFTAKRILVRQLKPQHPTKTMHYRPDYLCGKFDLNTDR